MTFPPSAGDLDANLRGTVVASHCAVVDAGKTIGVPGKACRNASGHIGGHVVPGSASCTPRAWPSRRSGMVGESNEIKRPEGR
jgi:hypothetical protein